MEFSTSDNGNDAWSSDNCAAHFGGGNWWGDCDNNMNGKYGGNGDIVEGRCFGIISTVIITSLRLNL